MTEVTIKVSANFCCFQIPAIAYRMLIFDNFLQKQFLPCLMHVLHVLFICLVYFSNATSITHIEKASFSQVQMYL